ncbi:MAG TPA: hypothetical protein VH639_14020 [Bryobacteraceae bacterium]|jgi:hypothetical protein
MTQIFETKKFRVQIVGASAWVETSEGYGWVFRSQHVLPVALSAARGKNSIPVLRAALEHYEKVHDGDQALRVALTGSSVKQAPSPSISRAVSGAVQAESDKLQASPRDRDVPTSPRGPLRPPLSGPDIGLPQRA